MYQEYLPDACLSHLIEVYWVADGRVEYPVQQRILPDGCVDIVFDFGYKNTSGKLQTGLPKLVGTMTSLIEFTYHPGQIQMMGIRFAPGGITAFTTIPIFEITNQDIDLPLSETLFDNSFYEQLPDMHCMQKRITYINQYFLKHLHKLYIPDRQIRHAVSFIQNSYGQLSVKRLAEESCLGERHFERRFKTAIGVSPKTFSNVIRFRSTLRYLETHPQESLFSASIACGYHDLSHMNKEFRRLGNISPSEL